jgi:superfamily II DNA/RNA helicase
MSFKDLIEEPGILKAIEDLDYNTPTPIQKQAIPLILTGCDLRGSAQTGTGKTAAFILPALCKLAKPSKLHGRGPRVLILVPTRELAIQVAEEASKYCKYLDRIKTVCIYGGAPYPIQNRQLARPYEILVATPGRLMDHMNRGKINFSRVEMFILDEADRMLDMGFIGPVEEIAEAIPDSRQTLMFSATLKGSVMKLSERLLKDPKEISVAHDPATHDNINQRLLHVDNIEHKYKLLDHILNGKDITQAIVFTRTKHHADQLVDKLIKKGYSAGALHGNMNQRQRTKTIMKLRQGEIRILIATDVAARGIDIPAISHVINFDLPENEEDYVHRIGRTGRAGATGIALSFATPKEMHFVRQIEKFTHQKMTSHTVPGMEPRTSAASSSPAFVSQGNYRPKQKKSNFRRFSRR